MLKNRQPDFPTQNSSWDALGLPAEIDGTGATPSGGWQEQRYWLTLSGAVI